MLNYHNWQRNKASPNNVIHVDSYIVFLELNNRDAQMKRGYSVMSFIEKLLPQL